MERRSTPFARRQVPQLFLRVYPWQHPTARLPAPPGAASRRSTRVLCGSHIPSRVILAYMCVKLQMRLYVCHRVGPFRVHFGSILGPFWVHFGSILGPYWVHIGSILGPFWVILGPICLLSEW